VQQTYSVQKFQHITLPREGRAVANGEPRSYFGFPQTS
jgi:hypothetical protein